MLHLVQAYRGFAALLVVLYHASAAAIVFSGDAAPLHWFGFGWSGVQFFFVLSGYIIFLVHRADIDRPEALGPYATKRVIRIWPMYALVTLVLAPVWLFTATSEPYYRDIGALIASLFLVPQPHPPHLAVAWTLIHEVIFYIAFATLIANRKAGIALFAIWGALVVYANAFTELAYPLNYFGSINNLLFALGMLAAAIPRDFSWPTFIAGNLLFLAAGYFANAGETGIGVILAFGLASFLVLLTARRLDSSFRSPFLQLLGAASYSIYLVHYPAISVLNKFMHVGPLAGFAINAVFATCCGIGAHLLVEKPLLRRLRRRFAQA
jgi:exopolysaccharide production protein ExoZ